MNGERMIIVPLPQHTRTCADKALTALPVQQIKTTASGTYRVWPNCGVLGPSQTQRVQILLLGSQVRP